MNKQTNKPLTWVNPMLCSMKNEMSFLDCNGGSTPNTGTKAGVCTPTGSSVVVPDSTDSSCFGGDSALIQFTCAYGKTDSVGKVSVGNACGLGQSAKNTSYSSICFSGDGF